MSKPLFEQSPEQNLPQKNKPSAVQALFNDAVIPAAPPVKPQPVHTVPKSLFSAETPLAPPALEPLKVTQPTAQFEPKIEFKERLPQQKSPQLLFEEGKKSELITLMTWIKTEAPKLNLRQIEFLEFQAIALLPLEIKTLNTWAQDVLQHGNKLSEKISQMTQEMRALNSDDLFAKIISALQDSSSSWVNKLISKKSSPADYKQALEHMIQTVDRIIQTSESLKPEFDNHNDDLILLLLLIKGVQELIPMSPLIEESLSSKSRLIQTTTMHAQTLAPHAEETMRTAFRWKQEAEQILFISIPAWELSHKK
jgi:hypothetical protein